MATATETRQYTANPADLPEGTLVELFYDAVERHDSDDAVRDKLTGRWRSTSHAEILDRVEKLATWLRSLGLERGERVAILSENRPEWAQADFAALCAGFPDVPVYATLPADQVRYILADSGARLVFVSTAEQLEKVKMVWQELPELAWAVVFDPVEDGDERVMTFEGALSRGGAEGVDRAEFKRRAHEARPQDLATMLYTSGTTGKPKGVQLTHNNVHSNVQACRPLLPMTPDDVGLSFLPLSHILQRMVDYLQFQEGVTISYVSDLALVLESFSEIRPHLVVSTPRVYEKFYNAVQGATGVKGKLVGWATRVGERWTEARLAGRAPSPGIRIQHGLVDRLVFSKLRDRVGGRLRFFVSGGAPLAGHIAEFFYGARIMILEGYGLTETSPVTNVNTFEDFRFGTVGKAVPGTEIMIADDGEILVRGPQVMKGYHNMPEATREAIDDDGWFHTGDIGEIDADGFLRITDRKKDLIVTAGGKNIAPQPIENHVKQSPLVEEAVMVGDRRPFAIMLVVPAFEALEGWAREQGITETDRAALLQDERVQEKVEREVFGLLEGYARFERPKKLGLLAAEFSIEGGELTPTLKVKRRVVEERFGSTIDAIYAATKDDAVVVDVD